MDALHRPIIETIHRALGPRYAHFAEPLAEEVFIDLFAALENRRVEPGTDLAIHAYHIAFGYCASHADVERASSSRRHTDPAPSDDLSDRDNSSRWSPIARALHGLSAMQRFAIILFEYQQLSLAEIATVLTVSPKAAELILLDGRWILGRALSAHA